MKQKQQKLTYKMVHANIHIKKHNYIHNSMYKMLMYDEHAELYKNHRINFYFFKLFSII